MMDATAKKAHEKANAKERVERAAKAGKAGKKIKRRRQYLPSLTMYFAALMSVAAAVRCDTTAFVEWARQGGATISPDVALEPPDFSASSLGVFAQGSLAPGATVARVPYSLLFSPLWCHHSPDAKAAIALVGAVLGRTGAAHGGATLNPAEQSALLLACETAAGNASYWAPWIRCLSPPTALETPTVWSE